MNDLNKLLEQASEPEDIWGLDRQALVAEGHKRVVRRRWIAAIACAASVAVIAGVAATIDLSGRSTSQQIVDEPTVGSGDYVETRIPVAEVERRCTIAMNTLSDMNPDTKWVAGARDGRAVSAIETDEDIETREGFPVPIEPEGGRIRGGRDYCIIPQQAMLDEITAPGPAVPESDDHEAILDWCSHGNGYDVREWTVLATAAQARGVLQAVLMADNGYAARCDGEKNFVTLEVYADRYADDSGKPILPDGDTGPDDSARYERLFRPS